MQALKHPHLLSKTELYRLAESGPEGLSKSQAQHRAAQSGPNRLAEEKRPNIFSRIAGQIMDPMVLVLLAAALISALFGEWADSGVIAVVILLNSALGVYQEGRAEKAIEALARTAAPQAVVRRDNALKRISAEELVVGDIVLLAAGDAAPADIRLLDAYELRVDESSLTGESHPVDKQPREMPEEAISAAPSERTNMVYMGSPILYGRGEGLVAAIGMDTQTGRIAHLLASTEQQATPLQKKLAELSQKLSLAVLVICGVVFIITLFSAELHDADTLLETLMLAISLAVAAIPEGLVVVVTLVLAMGMSAISREKGMIRRLNAVETLGATQVICSDKTGTLTENRMRVVAAYGLSEPGLISAALCNSLPQDLNQGGEQIGDPTELALANYAREKGFDRARLLQQQPFVAELPFDSGRKRMSTLHQATEGRRQYSKGAPELLLDCCDRWHTGSGHVVPLTEEGRRQVLEAAHGMSRQALRVLAVAYSDQKTLAEQNLVFAGLLGLADPPRPGVGEAVASAAAAGIRTVMTSGDSLDTAVAIGRELGILQPESLALTGKELSAMSDQELTEALPKIQVFARLKPEDKLRIVRCYQGLGQVTAMTGDGVNDAPALKAADIGVGMGISGSEVSRRVAALVLADDNYATIVKAVAEGRRIYENIRKALQFLLSSNLAEVLAIFAASLAGWHLFLPIHLLWINLITDCFPAIALGLEKAEPELMRQPPRPSEEGVFAGGMAFGILWQGCAVAALTLIAFMLGSPHGEIVGMTMAFVTLSMGEIFHAWNMRSRSHSIFSLSTANPYLTGAMLLCVCLDLLLLYVPALSGLFRITALSGPQLLTALLLAFAIIPLVELVKLKNRLPDRGRA